MHEDLINQIQHLKQRIEDERELSFSHLYMVHNVLPILKNMELVLANGQETIGWLVDAYDYMDDVLNSDERHLFITDKRELSYYIGTEEEPGGYEITPVFTHAQPTPEQNEWQDISTADLTDDLVWLYDGVDSIEGPRILEIDDYDRFPYWAECTWPSTIGIDKGKS